MFISEIISQQFTTRNLRTNVELDIVLYIKAKICSVVWLTAGKVSSDPATCRANASASL